MLLITQEIIAINYSQLMHVYEESIQLNGRKTYPRSSPVKQVFFSEQDLYSYLRFALGSGCWLAVWVESGCYQSAVRLEPYKDGLLVTALETARNVRNKGYAQTLMNAVLQNFSAVKIYAHIYADNKISIHLHEKLGFKQIKKTAEFLDGTVTSDAYTFMIDR